MKTVSTKVDESVYQKLIESCGKSGKCISENIRNMIENTISKPESKDTNITEKPVDRSNGFAVKINIIPNLKHEIKTESNYAIINDQYFKKCEPLPKATNVKIVS